MVDGGDTSSLHMTKIVSLGLYCKWTYTFTLLDNQLQLLIPWKNPPLYIMIPNTILQT